MDQELPQKLLNYWGFGSEEFGSFGGREQTHIIFVGLFFVISYIYAIGQEAEKGTSPQQEGEAAKQLFTEFDPLWSGWRRG